MRWVLVLLLGLFWSAWVQAIQPASSAGDAARQVQAETGGRILRVDSDGQGFRVRVLLPNGNVRTLYVPKR